MGNSDHGTTRIVPPYPHFPRFACLEGVRDSLAAVVHPVTLQGYLAYKKPRPPRTLP